MSEEAGGKEKEEVFKTLLSFILERETGFESVTFFLEVFQKFSKFLWLQ